MTLARILLAGALVAPGLALAQPAAAPEPAVVATTEERTAVVESVNLTERSVLLRGDSGSQSGMLATVRVGPQVRNLAQVRPGDRVVLTVTDAIAASVAPAGDGLGPTGGADVATRAAPGERPAASVSDGRRVRVRVDSVDQARNSVTFTEPDGVRKTVSVANPRMRQFIRGLNPGDLVDVVYVESVSLRVLPAAP
jgi:hypothetical protein